MGSYIQVVTKKNAIFNQPSGLEKKIESDNQKQKSKRQLQKYH